MRSLSTEEAELWARVAATIRPLKLQRTVPQATEKPEKIVKSPWPIKAEEKTVAASRHKAVPIHERTLDSSWDKKLRSGSVQPDRILDLHGMNLNSAWAAIDLGLDQAVARGDRLLLLITGHHRPGEPPIERGRIRAAVHDWLAVSRHSGDIAAVRGAHRRHGGGGSLYIVLRRRSHPR